MSVSSVEVFCSSATQYYVAGRFAALAGFIPVAGNLLHHAVEMYVKGCLSKTKTLAQLKALSHNLPNIWSAFKSAVADACINRFDDVISSLHQFEELRYPDSVLAKGMVGAISVKRPAAPLSVSTPAGSEPAYELCLEDIDALVGAVFIAGSVNPKFFLSGLSPTARRYLQHDNAEPWAAG